MIGAFNLPAFRGVEKDIIKTFNVSMSSSSYANSVINLFHARLPAVLQQAALWRLTLGFPIQPLCEQPMNPTQPIAKCVKSKRKT